MWSTARLTFYLTGILVAVATGLKLSGLATYDSATHVIDINPFNVDILAGLILTFLSGPLAAIAVLFKWGR